MCKAENSRGGCVQDYTQILAHREGQIKANEARLGTLVAQHDELLSTLQERDITIGTQATSLAAADAKLLDAKTVMVDKERLEEQVVQQMDLINKQADELAVLQSTLQEREAQLSVSQVENGELQLKASISKAHRIMFDEAWIVETTHHRCRGTAPTDRDGQLLVALPGATLHPCIPCPPCAALRCPACFNTEAVVS